MVPWPSVQKPWLKQNQPYYTNHYQHNVVYNYQHHGFQTGPPQRRPPPSVSEQFQIDVNARYTGTVSFYAKWKGYGFIEMAQKGVVPNDRLFVHWRQLQSEDRFPFLSKGMEVEFGLLKWKDAINRNIWTLRARNVSMVGGMSIAMQDELDSKQKTFVGGQHLRYTGTLKFFSPRHGFGYVVMDQGYDVDPTVPSQLRIETPEVNAGGKHPTYMENIAVEFGIWRTQRGAFKIYNMTLPGGHPLTQDALENRISMGPQTYIGDIAIWNWRQGWGFIKAEASQALPPRVLAKLAQQQAAARQRGRHISNDKMLYFRRPDCVQGFNPQRGMQVMFQLYIDDKGAGACEVHG